MQCLNHLAPVSRAVLGGDLSMQLSIFIVICFSLPFTVKCYVPYISKYLIRFGPFYLQLNSSCVQLCNVIDRPGYLPAKTMPLLCGFLVCQYRIEVFRSTCLLFEQNGDRFAESMNVGVKIIRYRYCCTNRLWGSSICGMQLCKIIGKLKVQIEAPAFS